MCQSTTPVHKSWFYKSVVGVEFHGLVSAREVLMVHLLKRPERLPTTISTL